MAFGSGDESVHAHLSAAFDKAVAWTAQMLEIIEAIDSQDYDEALALAISSDLPDEVRSKLEKALMTDEPEIINKVLEDYKGRLGHAFCEPCWNGRSPGDVMG